MKPGFWFIGQGFGEEKNGEPYLWRRPDPEELLASIMLSLAHGVKGIVFWNYDSYSTVGGIYVIGIVDENGSPSNLWYLIHDNLVPRLNGKFGRTLLGLDYTGNYLQLKYTQPTQPVPVTWDYLTLGIGQPAEDMNWHAGFLKDSLNLDNNYFLLANLWTIAQKSIYIKVTEPVPGYENYSFRNVESGYLDTTFSGEIAIQLTYPAGEGYLYQVAPVIKYGGKLITDDTVKTNTSLGDNMTIRNGATVTINDGKQYTAMDTIKLEGTGFISGEGYFDRGSSGWVILDSWDYSVFKGREGDHPKIIWSKHPTVANILDYKVYRDKGTSGWLPIKTLSNNVFEYIDSAVTIIEGDTTQNEVAAEYFVVARYFQGLQIKSDSSNTITYLRVEGGSWEKSGTGMTKTVYTYSLSQNYPNPFNPTTTIEYSIERDGNVELEILDILGRKVTTLVNEHKPRGFHSVIFDDSNLSSGIYFYRIRSGKFIETKKMILLK